MSTGPKRICPSCGETVPTVWVDTEIWRELRCGYCGLTLDRLREFDRVAEGEVATAERGPTVAATAATLAESPKQNLQPLILVAEDSKFLRTIVVEHLEHRFPKAEILVGTDGREALTAIARALIAGPRRGVAVLDLQMPRLNGLNMAVSLRAIEDALGYATPLPVIFFSGVKVNDTLKKAMAEANPAAYLHKADGQNPASLMGRLEEVMGLMIRRVYEP